MNEPTAVAILALLLTMGAAPVVVMIFAIREWRMRSYTKLKTKLNRKAQ